MPNTLCQADNLDILRRYIKDELVDLIYLDPPFKSQRNWEVLFRERTRPASVNSRQGKSLPLSDARDTGTNPMKMRVE